MRLIAIAPLFVLAWSASAKAADPTHYLLDAKFDVTQGTIAIGADVSISTTPADHNAIFLLGSSYTITSATADRGARVLIEPSPNANEPQTLVVRASAAADRVTFHVRYNGKLGGADGVNALSSERIELSADSMWYPLSANFNARFMLDAKLAGVPPTFAIVSPDDVRRSGNTVMLRRLQPSLDIAFSGGPNLHHAIVGALDLYAADLNSRRVAGYLENGPIAVDFFQHWFGALPTKRVTVAVVRRANGTGYSRPGYVVVADTAELPADEIWARAGYIAHEISHAWWSNADFTSEDYWLVESTAEYSALRYIESRYNPQTRQRMLNAKQARAANAGPLIGKGRPSNDAVYAKGPLLLFELEGKIGRPKFDAMLASLAARKRITTRDFLAALTQACGAADAAAFESKLRQ